MNQPAGAQPERRRHARILAKGAVTMLVEGNQHRGRIGNFGRGGMFVLVDAPSPELWHGELALEIRLDGPGAEWVAAIGRVTFVLRTGVGIAFESTTAKLRAMVDELDTASLANARVVSVVLIDADPARRAAMMNGFRAAGCAVIAVATQLEAIVRLGESSFEPDVIAVADSPQSTAAAEMRAFIERDHPNVKLVTIGDELREPAGIANWLSAADPASDLAVRVREVLVRPRRATIPGV
ncbi:MAG TPA: PilZ domain-containing protein [Kofleriaceae bacterium]|nr:PilZ domain-containing protein [Kofleriaceae bacterium]